MQPKDNQTPQGITPQSDNQINTNASSEQSVDIVNADIDNTEKADGNCCQDSQCNQTSLQLDANATDSDKQSTFSDYQTGNTSQNYCSCNGNPQPNSYNNGDTATKPYVDKAWRDITGKSMLYAVFVVMLLLLVTLVLRVYFYCPVQVEQKSMYPTYDEGDRLWVYKTQTIQRGQVVVFFQDGTGSTFLNFVIGDDRLIIKRVVALAGDQIWVEQQADGSYIVCVLPKDSDTVLYEDYYTKDNQPVQIPNINTSDDVGLGILKQHIGRDNALTIEEGHFFAMGDNRAVSDDSRGSFGQIPMSHLLGVVEQ